MEGAQHASAPLHWRARRHGTAPACLSRGNPKAIEDWASGLDPLAAAAVEEFDWVEAAMIFDRIKAGA